MKIKIQDLIIYDDSALIAVNKPAGLPVLPDGYNREAPHLVRILQPEFGPLMIVHRLDKDTSGLVILARTPEAHRSLNIQLEKRLVAKTYHALVVGTPPWETKSIHMPLRVDGDRRHRTIVDSRQGKPAHTDLRLLERFTQYSLLEVLPHTGRTHQIRVHLAAVGLPIVADALYGTGESLYLSAFKPDFQPNRESECALLKRLGLHACSTRFTHPITGREMQLNAPYPKDFNGALRQLRRYDHGSQDIS